MLYTVKEVSELSGVTIKTLHHYHKIGLLQPAEISDAGYRLYGAAELELLQQIRFYREMDFPLEQIKELMEETPDRLSILTEQEKLLLARWNRLERVLQTLRQSIEYVGGEDAWSRKKCSKVLIAKKSGRMPWLSRINI